jgi:putative ABC transport system permease protein
VIQGLGPGHADHTAPHPTESVLKRDGTQITANASVREYQEITEANIGSFHFHGDTSSFPITAVIAIPSNHKSMTLLMGQYQDNDSLQLAQPNGVVHELLATVFAIQNLVLIALAIIGTVTFLLVIVVFMLSLKQRSRELETIVKIGGSRGRVVGMILTEIGTVMVSGLAVASLLTWLTLRIAPFLVRELLMS